MANLNFNAAEVEPDMPFAPLPAGDYIAQVVDSDVKTTRNNNGQYLALQFEILDGEFKGRRVFSNITIANTNETAQQIGQSQLSSLCRAVNVMQLNNTSQLHNIPLKIALKIRVDEKYGEQNDVKSFEPAAGVSTAPAAQPAATQAAQPAPWER